MSERKPKSPRASEQMSHTRRASARAERAGYRCPTSGVWDRTLGKLRARPYAAFVPLTDTGNWWLFILGAGAEALWMVFASDSRLLQKAWFDKMHAEHEKAAAARALTDKLSSLPTSQGDRVQRLDEKRQHLLKLCADNQAIASELMRGELGKLDKLVASFAELMVSTYRYEQYLESVDLRAFEGELTRQRKIVENDTDAERRDLAQRNLSVLMKRQEKLAEIKAFIGRARAQMQLIENTFELLSDQIVTMRSPRELDGQLDELIDGVEAVRTTARETEALLAEAAR